MPPQLDALSIVAILRGVRPDEVVGIAEALVRNDIRAIEVPLNSPDPLRSIERLAAALGDSCLCGAGTVLHPAQVDDVRAAGGSLIVAPNTDERVVRRALELELAVMPGFATATEAFAAIQAGATHLKLFPAATYGPGHVTALRAVLPATVSIYAVGGVAVHEVQRWLSAGVRGFGIGSELYRPGWSAQEVGERAAAIVTALRACTKTRT